MTNISTNILILELYRRVASVYLGESHDEAINSLNVMTIKQLHRTLKSSRDQLVKNAEED